VVDEVHCRPADLSARLSQRGSLCRASWTTIGSVTVGRRRTGVDLYSTTVARPAPSSSTVSQRPDNPSVVLVTSTERSDLGRDREGSSLARWEATPTAI
jgi:hypothetical protein